MFPEFLCYTTVYDEVHRGVEDHEQVIQLKKRVPFQWSLVSKKNSVIYYQCSILYIMHSKHDSHSSLTVYGNKKIQVEKFKLLICIVCLHTV